MTKKLPAITIIFCLGLLVYSNSFNGSFHFDDFHYIRDNRFIRDIPNLFSHWEFYPCRFVTFLSIALNYYFNGLNLFDYHLFNLAVHCFAAFFVWWLVLLTLSTPAMKKDPITGHGGLIALLAGLVFVSHPVQTEAVTYIWQRTASMMAMFYLASLCFYIKSRLSFEVKEMRINYTCSLVAAVLAMFTKENAVTLPVAVLLYEICFFEFKNINWKRLFPILLTILIIPLTILLTKSGNFLKAQGYIDQPKLPSESEYLLTQFRVMATYIRLAFLPLKQNMCYDYSISKNFFEGPTLISFFFLAGVFYGALRLFSKYRLLSFAIFFFFLTLSPESSFLPLVDVIFEHRLYLPLAGYSLFLVSALYYLLGKKGLKTMTIILTMIIAFNSILTYQRNKVWENDITLWTDAIKKAPHHARAYYGLGEAYFQTGDFKKSILNYNEGLKIDPGYINAYINRGGDYYMLGNFPNAMADLNKAIQIKPDVATAFYTRGDIYVKLNKLPQAMSDYNKAIELDPAFGAAYMNRGNICLLQGDLTGALSNYNKTIAINPDAIGAYFNRAVVNFRLKKYSEAQSDMFKVQELQANSHPDENVHTEID